MQTTTFELRREDANSHEGDGGKIKCRIPVGRESGEFAPQNNRPVHRAVLAALLVECEQEKLLSRTSHLSSVLQQANKLSSNFPDSCRDVTKMPSKDVMMLDAKTKEAGKKSTAGSCRVEQDSRKKWKTRPQKQAPNATGIRED